MSDHQLKYVIHREVYHPTQPYTEMFGPYDTADDAETAVRNLKQFSPDDTFKVEYLIPPDLWALHL